MNKINLNEKEKRILQALYELEDISISKIAKKTLINRTTLYPILDKLLAKGLISKLTVEGRVIFRPISSEELKKWAKRKEQEFKKESENLLNWVKTIKVAKVDSLFSDVKYFEGFDGVKNLYVDTWRNNKDKIIYAITDYEAAYKTMGDDFFRKDYFKTRVSHGVRVKNLLPESEVGKKDFKKAKKLLREMKFIKLFKELGIEINIYDNKLAIISFNKESPSGVLIKNDTIAKAFKNIFEYLWKSVK